MNKEEYATSGPFVEPREIKKSKVEVKEEELNFERDGEKINVVFEAIPVKKFEPSEMNKFFAINLKSKFPVTNMEIKKLYDILPVSYWDQSKFVPILIEKLKEKEYAGVEKLKKKKLVKSKE